LFSWRTFPASRIAAAIALQFLAILPVFVTGVIGWRLFGLLVSRAFGLVRLWNRCAAGSMEAPPCFGVVASAWFVTLPRHDPSLGSGAL
jgi:hypothetical protein